MQSSSPNAVDQRLVVLPVTNDFSVQDHDPLVRINTGEFFPVSFDIGIVGHDLAMTSRCWPRGDVPLDRVWDRLLSCVLALRRHTQNLPPATPTAYESTLLTP